MFAAPSAIKSRFGCTESSCFKAKVRIEL